jgi:hypothetical protein
MKIYGGGDIGPPLLTSSLDGVVNFTLRHFFPEESLVSIV